MTEPLPPYPRQSNPERARAVLSVVAMVMAIIFVIAGLALVAYFVLLVSVFANFGSNK